MRNYNYELNKIKKAMSQETEALKHHITAFKTIEPVLKQFDGKVVNIRLEKAIKEQTGHCIYLKQGELCSYARNYAEYSRQKSFTLVIEDKRLNAAETIIKLRDFVTKLLTELDTYTYDESKILAYFKEMEEMDLRIQELRKTMPYVVRDHSRSTFYNIKN